MKIAVIGCGNMGKGLVKRLSTTSQVSFYDRNPEKTSKLEQEGFGKAYSDCTQMIKNADMVILAVKPQNLKEAATLIGNNLNEHQTLVSLLTGTSVELLKGFFPAPTIVRMMPNMALVYGEGVIGLVSDEKLSKQDKDALTKTFESLGTIYWLPESKINALTALTGSGPAFFFLMVEAMVDAGIAMGFSAKDAQGLVYQMIQGGLTLLEKTEKHPGELKWQITSPQGTTIAGIKKLEELALRGGVINTFLAAYECANQLSSRKVE
jgi:pyrroline-5-carboxylate reductase